MNRWLTLRPACTVAERSAGRLSVTTGDGRIIGFSPQSRPLLELLLEGIPEPELDRIRHQHPKLSGIFLSLEEQGLTYLSVAPPPSKTIAQPEDLSPGLSATTGDRAVGLALFLLILLQLAVAFCIHELMTAGATPSAPQANLWLGAFFLVTWICTHEYAHFFSAKILGVKGGKIHWISGRRALPCFRAPEQHAAGNPATKILIFLAGPLWDTAFLLAWGIWLGHGEHSAGALAFWLLVCAASLGNAIPSGQSDLGQASAAVKQYQELRVGRVFRRIYFWTFCGYSIYTLLCVLQAGERVAAGFLG